LPPIPQTNATAALDAAANTAMPLSAEAQKQFDSPVGGKLCTTPRVGPPAPASACPGGYFSVTDWASFSKFPTFSA
jgi:hypothetical protein